MCIAILGPDSLTVDIEPQSNSPTPLNPAVSSLVRKNDILRYTPDLGTTLPGPKKHPDFYTLKRPQTSHDLPLHPLDLAGRPRG